MTDLRKVLQINNNFLKALSQTETKEKCKVAWKKKVNFRLKVSLKSKLNSKLKNLKLNNLKILMQPKPLEH